MEEQKFKQDFIACFLASWCANKYEDCCMRGEQSVLGNPPVEDAEDMADAAWEKIIENCNTESKTTPPSKKWADLYHVVNVMMMTLGADGEINTGQAVAGNVMAALAAIDGGQYNPELAGDD